MIPSRCRFIAIVGLALTTAVATPSDVSSQAPDQPASIPANLVTALFGAVRVTVGEAPRGFPADLIPPAPASVVGGGTSGRELTVIFAYPGALTPAPQAYNTHLEVAGFKRPPSPETLRGGFVDGDDARVPWLCRDSVRVMVRPASGARSGSYIQVGLSFDPNEYASCGRNQGAPRGYDPDAELRFPVLRAPLGAQSMGGGSGSNGDRQREINTRLGLTMSVTDLLAHYAPQLDKAGWKVGTPVVGDGAGLQSVTVTDHRGREWRGALIVLRLPDYAHVSLEMIRAGST